MTRRLVYTEDRTLPAAPESTELPFKAWIEVPAREGTPAVDASACEHMPSAEVAPTTPMTSTSVSTCGHGVLYNPHREHGGSREIRYPAHVCFLPRRATSLKL